MPKVVVLSLGYNEIKNYLGVFESVEKCEEFLISAGAEVVNPGALNLILNSWDYESISEKDFETENLNG